jgi:hypothetical protein
MPLLAEVSAPAIPLTLVLFATHQRATFVTTLGTIRLFVSQPCLERLARRLFSASLSAISFLSPEM